MKSEKENEKVNTDEMGVAIGVDNEVIHKVRSGEITHIIVDINEDNQNMFLENIDGNLVLVTEEMPDTFHGMAASFRMPSRACWSSWISAAMMTIVWHESST